MTTTCDSDGDPYLELLSKAAKALENAAIPSQLKDRLLTPVTGGTASERPTKSVPIYHHSPCIILGLAFY